MAMNKDFDVFTFLEAMETRSKETQGKRVYPTFAKVNIKHPKTAALEVFERMERQYGLPTSLVDARLSEEDSVLLVGQDDLETWAHYIGLFKSLGESLPDEWAASRDNGSYKAESKERSGATAPLSSIPPHLPRLVSTCR
jgi:hypothetical protein